MNQLTQFPNFKAESWRQGFKTAVAHYCHSRETLYMQDYCEFFVRLTNDKNISAGQLVNEIDRFTKFLKDVPYALREPDVAEGGVAGERISEYELMSISLSWIDPARCFLDCVHFQPYVTEMLKASVSRLEELPFGYTVH